MGPIVEKVLDELGIDFEKIDASKDYKLADKYLISAVPVFVLLKDDYEVDRKLGAIPGPQFKEWIEEYSDEECPD